MQIFNKKISHRGRDKIDRLGYKAIRNNEYCKLKISTLREAMKKTSSFKPVHRAHIFHRNKAH